MLNHPKTGSTFARSVIKRIIEKRKCDPSEFFIDLQLQNIKIKGRSRPDDQHGTYFQIPREYSYLPVISVVRNPYERLLSTYEFRHWAQYHETPKSIILRDFNNFPDLSFKEYVCFTDSEMIYGRFGGVQPKAQIGIQTALFIQMFFKNPEVVLQSISDEYIDSQLAVNDMGPIIFLRQETLRNDLKALLLSCGFSDVELDLLRSEEDINVTPRKSSHRNDYWDPEIVDHVAWKERLIFKILSSKGIFYEKPLVNAKRSSFA